MMSEAVVVILRSRKELVWVWWRTPLIPLILAVAILFYTSSRIARTT